MLNETPHDSPEDYDTLNRTILERGGALPPRLLQVASFVTTFPDEVAFGTTASIAAAAGVQPSTLVRFARAFGFDGFSTMQRLFRNRLRGPATGYIDRVSALPASGDGILHGFLAAARDSLDRAALIRPERFENAARILGEAGTIYLIGRMRAFPVTAYMAYALGKAGVGHRLLPSTIGADADLLALARPGDAAFAVSFSPYAPETVEAARTLARRRIPVVSLTDSAFSPLAECSSEWLELPEAPFGDFRSLSASMAVAMALTMSIASHRRNGGTTP